MKQYFLGILSVLFLIGCAFGEQAALGCEGEETILVGVVKKVLDGDSVIFKTEAGTELEVRLDKIDAPEKGQAYANEARAYLKRMTVGKPSKLQQEDLDQYGRVVGVLFCDGVEVNLKMVQEGYAWHYSYHDRTQVYTLAEQAARKQRRGLWKDEHPINPYLFRKSQPKTRRGAH